MLPTAAARSRIPAMPRPGPGAGHAAVGAGRLRTSMPTPSTVMLTSAVHRRFRRVPRRVGQALPHDPIGRRPDQLTHERGGPVDLPRSGERPARCVRGEQFGQVGDRRGGCQLGHLGIAAEHPEQAADLVERLRCRSRRCVSNSACRRGGTSVCRYGAVCADTTTIDMWWATTSCRSRAILVRSCSTVRRARSRSLSSSSWATCRRDSTRPAHQHHTEHDGRDTECPAARPHRPAWRSGTAPPTPPTP